MTAEVRISRDVRTTLNFIHTLDAQPPYEYHVEPPPGVPRTNICEDTRPVVIHDARGMKDTLTLDANGFQFVNYPSTFAEKDFLDVNKIKTDYYAEIEDILKKYTGAQRVFIFNHIVRWSTPDHGPIRGPIHCVHVDHAFVSAPEHIKSIFEDEAERLLKGRYRVINVCRPIANPVAHTPLALADYRTVDPEDLFLVSQIDPHRTNSFFDPKHDRGGSAVTFRYNPGHKWYYLSDQTPDEVVLFKNFDSDIDKAHFAPHSAFHDTTSPADAPQRQSIDIRAFVFDTE